MKITNLSRLKMQWTSYILKIQENTKKSILIADHTNESTEHKATFSHWIMKHSSEERQTDMLAQDRNGGKDDPFMRDNTLN